MTKTTTALGALSVAALLLTAGCSNNDGINLGGETTSGTSSSTTSASTPTPSNLDDAVKQAVLQQYLAYWKAGDKMGANPSADRQAVAAAYAPVAGDPVLSSNVDAVVNAALAGRAAYGEHKPLQPVVQLDALDATKATIQDCVDTSNSGDMDKATGKKLTVGVPRAWSVSEAVKGLDGVWRITDVTFDDTKVC